jgi:hypothetical protein
MHHSEFVVARLRHFGSRTLTRAGTLALLGWLTCKPAFADLPSVEAPESSGGSGLSGQIKGYLQDGIVHRGSGRGGHCLYQRRDCRRAHLYRSPQ